MHEGRAGHTATLLLDGKVVIAGGGDDPLATAESYDPTSRSWSVTAAMVEVREGHTATLLPNGMVLVAGGCCARGDVYPLLASAELYDPSSGSWSATESMDGVPGGITATLLVDGKVLVLGGIGDVEPVQAFAELYDPGSGT